MRLPSSAKFEEFEEETWSVGQIIKQSSNKTTQSVSRWFCEERFLRLLKREEFAPIANGVRVPISAAVDT